MKAQMSKLPARYSQVLLNHIAVLKTKHPKWGYRRIYAYLHYPVSWKEVSQRTVRQYLRALVN
jgi:hypothetical protein